MKHKICYSLMLVLAATLCGCTSSTPSDCDNRVKEIYSSTEEYIGGELNYESNERLVLRLNWDDSLLMSSIRPYDTATSEPGARLKYEYDKKGNLLYRHIFMLQGANDESGLLFESDTLRYENGRLATMLSKTSDDKASVVEKFEYDKAGHLVSRKGLDEYSYTWDGDRLTHIRKLSVSYTYGEKDTSDITFEYRDEDMLCNLGPSSDVLDGLWPTKIVSETRCANGDHQKDETEVRYKVDHKGRLVKEAKTFTHEEWRANEPDYYFEQKKTIKNRYEY